jgi:hypothetical protein
MTQLRHSIGILTALLVVSGGAMVLETRAADQSAQPAAPQPAPDAQPTAAQSASGSQRTAARAHRSDAAPAAAAATTPPKSASPASGAPQVPEESATIRDDPTIAPDPKQSADKNVSFPNDI